MFAACSRPCRDPHRENSASQLYLKNKAQACHDIGGAFRSASARRLTAARTGLSRRCRTLNADPRIHGILCSCRCRRSRIRSACCKRSRRSKDVDGFNWVNLGAMVAGRTLLAPCTPLGVMTMLDHARVPIEGRSAVVVGRSAIVGNRSRSC